MRSNTFCCAEPSVKGDVARNSGLQIMSADYEDTSVSFVKIFEKEILVRRWKLQGFTLVHGFAGILHVKKHYHITFNQLFQNSVRQMQTGTPVSLNNTPVLSSPALNTGNVNGNGNVIYSKKFNWSEVCICRTQVSVSICICIDHPNFKHLKLILTTNRMLYNFILYFNFFRCTQIRILLSQIKFWFQLFVTLLWLQPIKAVVMNICINF